MNHICPVCDSRIRNGKKCSNCGYEYSLDYESYKTLGKIKEESSTYKKHISYQNKQMQEQLRFLMERQKEEQEVELNRLKEKHQLELQQVKKKIEKNIDEVRKNKNSVNKTVQKKEGKKYYRVLALIVVVVVVIIGLKLIGDIDISGIKKIVYKYLKIETIEVGDVIIFGHYEQDNNFDNGPEEIEWNVLAVEDGKALIQSVYGLDVKPYNEEWKDITWERCTLRRWLNDDFYDKSFSENEKDILETTKVEAENNPNHDTDPGNDTNDNIFLLSTSEVDKYYDSYIGRMDCKATAYAKVNGAYINEYGFSKSSYWWLRSPGFDSRCATFVSDFGQLDYDGDYVSNNNVVVRPAMWIKL